jgi:hypothetical protein
MPIEQESSVPLTDDFSVNVQIRIYQTVSDYVAEINADGSNWHRFHIELKPDDVGAINSDLQRAIQDVSNSFDESDGTYDDTYNDSLKKLADTGNWAFNKIFLEQEREIIRKVLKAGASIQFSSEDYFIPWELLYDGPRDDEMDVMNFWGMRHIISRALILTARPDGIVSPKIQAPCPQVGLIAYSDLKNVKNIEIPKLEELDKGKKIRLSHCPPMSSNDPNQHSKQLKTLHRFFGESMHITHLACHADVNKEKISESCLVVSDDFPITMQDFEREEFKIKDNPFVILNACLTGIISPRHSCNWAIQFYKRGVRGVLATEFLVPDWFAAAFIEELYSNFLSGVTIGKALINTRRLFWQKGNPLGLAYSLYAPPSIIITSEK